ERRMSGRLSRQSRPTSFDAGGSFFIGAAVFDGAAVFGLRVGLTLVPAPPTVLALGGGAAALSAGTGSGDAAELPAGSGVAVIGGGGASTLARVGREKNHAPPPSAPSPRIPSTASAGARKAPLRSTGAAASKAPVEVVARAGMPAPGGTLGTVVRR